jgi:hypothetical protein
MMRFAAALVALTAAVCLVAPLTAWGSGLASENVAARAFLFYAVTAGGYAFLPFVRRGGDGGHVACVGRGHRAVHRRARA